MDLSTYISELRDSLQSAAALGDEHTQRTAAALTSALEPAARLALLHALSDLATEVTRQLADVDNDHLKVEVALDGRDVKIGVTRSSADSDGASASSFSSSGSGGASSESSSKTFADASGDLSRTTVRMFNELKAKAEKAAAAQGVSLNSFISRAVADSMRTDNLRKWKGRDGGPADSGDTSPTTISGYVQG